MSDGAPVPHRSSSRRSQRNGTMPSLHHDRAYDEREEFDKDDEMEYAPRW